MKPILLILPLIFTFTFINAQIQTDPDDLIQRGVALHDKGDYKGAIIFYDQALEIDPHNASALYEKAFSYLQMKEYKSAIKACKEAIKYNEGAFTLRMVYDNYGTCLDMMGKPEKAVKIYDEGIELFPKFYRLQFNKGITLLGLNKTEEALESFQDAIKVNPIHASSHHAIGLSILSSNKIPGILALSRVLIIEPTSERAKVDFKLIKKKLEGNVEKKSDQSYSITLDEKMFSGDDDGEVKENNFRTIEVVLALTSSLTMIEDSTNNEVERFATIFAVLFQSLAEKKDNYGFYWDYYGPYFTELDEKGHTTTFTYLAFSTQEEEYVQKWLDDNKEKIDEFYEWSANYKWE